MKTMIKVVMVAMLSMVAWADSYSYYETVPVWNSEPIYRDITIRVPHQECWTETVQVDKNNKTMGGILGGTAGGILGHQIGGGTGKDVATVAGAIIGTIVGTNIADDGTEYKTIQKCRTVYETSKERRKVGYRNYFEYNGKSLTKISKHKLHEVRVRVTVSY